MAVAEYRRIPGHFQNKVVLIGIDHPLYAKSIAPTEPFPAESVPVASTESAPAADVPTAPTPVLRRRR